MKKIDCIMLQQNYVCNMFSLNAEFVDKHKQTLIERVVMVLAIAEVLHSKHLIHDEVYSTIQTTQTRQDQMRKLYEALTTVKVKLAFYETLQETEPHLVQELGKIYCKMKCI